MRSSALKYTVLSWVSLFTMVIIFLSPFHAFLTVWGSTVFGHYTYLRLWNEVLLAISVVGVLYLLLVDHKIRFHTLSRRLVWLILSYIALNLVWGFLALVQHDVTAKALGYGLIVNLRFLVFFLVTWAVALRMARMRVHWQRLVIWPAVIVVVFGLIQEFALAPRFLEHFGYSKDTILPFQYVDSQPDLLRIQSTLRGANPLGAYLLVVITIITEILLNKRTIKNKKRLFVLVAASLVAMYFTYSRSAWLGLILSICIVAWVTIGPNLKKISLFAGVIALIIIGLLGYGFKNSSYVQTSILHTNNHTKPHLTSNQARAGAIRTGLHDVRHEPLGRGPGTAGPASVYNIGHKPRIAENFFVQIGQETGWLGMLLFLLINVGVGTLLFMRRDDPLALSLFASLIGLTLINMLSHAWADDTLAYVWWGLAGIALASLPETQIEGVEAVLADSKVNVSSGEAEISNVSKPAGKKATKPAAKAAKTSKAVKNAKAKK